MSKHAAGTTSGGPIYMAQDPETPEEISRRTFMVGAVNVLGAVIGLGLAIPIVGSLLPTGGTGKGNWAPLSPQEFKELQIATNKPMKLNFVLKGKDAYLPEQANPEYVWGIKTDPAKFKAARPDLFAPGGSSVPYDAINMGFVIFSPICPHLGCRFAWNDAQTQFLCPCHGSTYDFEGKHLAGPAERGLDPLPLQEKSGIAEITWIRYASTVADRIVISYQS